MNYTGDDHINKEKESPQQCADEIVKEILDLEGPARKLSKTKKGSPGGFHHNRHNHNRNRNGAGHQFHQLKRSWHTIFFLILVVSASFT